MMDIFAYQDPDIVFGDFKSTTTSYGKIPAVESASQSSESSKRAQMPFAKELSLETALQDEGLLRDLLGKT